MEITPAEQATLQLMMQNTVKAVETVEDLKEYNRFLETVIANLVPHSETWHPLPQVQNPIEMIRAQISQNRRKMKSLRN